MFLNFLRRRTAHVNYLFNARYIDPKGLYVSIFNEIPSAAYITEVNVAAAYPSLKQTLNGRIDKTFQHSHYNYDNGKVEFNVTFLVLTNATVVEIGGDYVGVYYRQHNYPQAEKLLQQIADFRVNKSASNRIGFSTQQEAHQN